MITVSKGSIHIENSCKVEFPIVMKEVLEEVKKRLEECYITIDTPFDHRSIKSMVNEWIAHNNLYRLGYKQDHTKSVDLDYPQKWYYRLGYWLLSKVTL